MNRTPDPNSPTGMRGGQPPVGVVINMPGLLEGIARDLEAVATLPTKVAMQVALREWAAQLRGLEGGKP